MLQLLNDLPEHVVGVKATGNVTQADVETVLIPAIDKLVAKTDKINYLLLLETDLSNWDFGAWMSDAKLGIQNFTKWTKIAVVSDKEGVNKFTDMFSAMIPGEAKGFRISELEKAKAWVAAPSQ